MTSGLPDASSMGVADGRSTTEDPMMFWAPRRLSDGRLPIATVKDVLWFLYLYPLRALVVRLSPTGREHLGRALEPLFRFFARRRVRKASQRMAVALGPTHSAPAITETTRRYVSNAIRRALDDFMLADERARSHVRPSEVQGIEHLEHALSSGKGAVLISGHFYANRLGKHFLAVMGYPILSVRNGQPPDRWMGRLGAKLLQKRYIEFLHGIIRDEVFIQDPECSLKILRRLRSGGLVNVHIDAAGASNWIPVPFFGHPRRFATGLLEIVRLSGCAVVPMLCLGTSSRSTVIFEEPLRLEPARTREEFVATNIRTLASTLERQIREHPSEWEQWVRL